MLFIVRVVQNAQVGGTRSNHSAKRSNYRFLCNGNVSQHAAHHCVIHVKLVHWVPDRYRSVEQPDLSCEPDGHDVK